MKLYTHIDRVYNELAELGKTGDAPLRAGEISAFDQMHYHGTDAVDDAIEGLKIGADAQVLEVGSGFGGPARRIAERVQARVLALELQPDQNKLAADLTRRCGLDQYVDHCCGDFLSYDWQGLSFDHIVSWLAIYHIPERAKLLRICRQLLKSDGLYFAEDLFAREPLETNEEDELKSGIYAAYLPDLQAYQADFAQAGFEVLCCDDMSDDWTQFTSERLSGYRESRQRQLRVHGEPTYQAMEQFYELVNRHFRSGKLGGVKIIARKI